MITILTVIGILMTLIGVLCLYTNKDIVQAIVYSIVAFVIEYVIISGLLFWINCFTITATLIIVSLLTLIVDAVLIIVFKRRATCSFRYMNSLPVIIIFLLILPITADKFGIYGMGQDQGVYQAKAIAIMNGYNDNYFDFNEYGQLISDEEKEEYKNEVDNVVVGFYTQRYKYSQYYDMTEYKSDVAGVFHGIPTYSAVLALFGSIFGMANMMHSSTLFLFCAVFMLYSILRKMKVRYRYCALGAFILACSPVVLWISKTSLTESLLMVMVLAFIYLITDKKYGSYRWFSCIPVIAFAMYHITIYVMMPMFFAAYIYMYLATNKRQFLYANVAALIGYLAGYRMMVKISTAYTYGNYKQLYVGGINAGNLGIVLAITVLVQLIIIVLTYVFKRAIRKKEGGISSAASKVMNIFLRIVPVVTMILFVVIQVKSGQTITYKTLYAYMISTGIIMLPLVFLVLFIGPRVYSRRRSMVMLTGMFIYTVCIYSLVFYRAVMYYYYYCRYIVPYLSIVIILGIVALNRIGKCVFFEKLKMQIWLPLCIAAVIFAEYYPYNEVIATQQDQTFLSWESLDKITNAVTKNDAVVMDSSLSVVLKFPLKSITGADVYPVVKDNRQQQIDNLKNSHNHVYYITEESNSKLVQDGLADNIKSVVYNTIGMDYQRIDDAKNSKYIPYSDEFTKTEQIISVIECK